MSLIVLSCPSCSRRLRMPSDKIIQTQCPACGRQFKVAYSKVQEDPLSTGAGNAVNGIMHRYRSWAYSSGYSNSLVYGDSILAIKRSVLALAVSDFDANLPVGAKLSRNQRFFRNALVYISETGQNTIYVKYNQRKALKDWTDYDAKTLESVDEIMELSNMLEGTKYPKPSVSPPESINRFFKDNTSDLESFLVKSIRTKVDSLIGLGTLRVQRHSNAGPATGIFMNVDYFVSTLEDDFTGYGSMPSLYIWTQTEESSYESIKVEGGNARFKGYMLATGIEWKLEVKYPVVERPYVYTQSSRPQAEIRDVNTQTQAQLRMMATAFHNFSEPFLAEFGVE